MIPVRIVLNHFHGLKLFKPGLFQDLVLTLISITLQVANIGDIPHIPYLVTKVLKVTEQQVKCNCRPGMPQMRIAVNGRPANIQAYMRGINMA
jgi:hypothetical protein